jgi:GT2 family glycosyltransferase
MPRLAILIPHHAGRHHLRPLFTSLLALHREAVEVELVLVDNHSQDGSCELVRREFPSVRILSLPENRGFAAALNAGARAVDAEWLVFLNNDVRVDADWLMNLMYAARRLEAPCFASRILDWHGKTTTFAGGWINLFAKGFEETEVRSDQPYEIFFPCGCGTLIRRELFLEIGGFDDEYFMLFEDIDLGWRLRLLGHPVYLVPDAFIRHRAHASLDRLPYTRKALFYERNSLATLYKNLDEPHRNLLLPLALHETLLRARAVGGIGVPVRYSPDGLAMLAAVDDFNRKLPHWRRRRAWLQSRRRIGDRELFERFFPHPEQLWAFNDTHYRRLHRPDVLPRLEALFAAARQGVGL